MTDYDVVNLGFTPEMAAAIEVEADIAINTDGKAWIFYATHRESFEACKDFVNRGLFKKKEPSQPEPEAKILGIKKNFFKGIKTLIHVTGENKATQMRKLFGEYVNPGIVPVADGKPRNRK